MGIWERVQKYLAGHTCAREVLAALFTAVVALAAACTRTRTHQQNVWSCTCSVLSSARYIVLYCPILLASQADKYLPFSQRPSFLLHSSDASLLTTLSICSYTSFVMQPHCVYPHVSMPTSGAPLQMGTWPTAAGSACSPMSPSRPQGQHLRWQRLGL